MDFIKESWATLLGCQMILFNAYSVVGLFFLQQYLKNVLIPKIFAETGHGLTDLVIHATEFNPLSANSMK